MPTDSLHMIALDDRHLQDALALSTEAHWNQTVDDWKMMMAAGNAIGMVDPGRRLVGSALTLPYGDTFGWISMVLVTESWRNKGLATKLLTRAMEMLEADGLIPALDATPAGENVYRPLGFEPHFSYQRWEIDKVPQACTEARSTSRSRSLDKSAMAALKARDRSIFGGDRGAILDSLAARSGGHARIAGRNGYILSRDGRVARQIGPLSADNPMIAIDLLDRALADMTGPVFIDACDHQETFVDRLKALGFRRQRSFLRMAKGRKQPFGDPQRMFALAGPELG